MVEHRAADPMVAEGVEEVLAEGVEEVLEEGVEEVLAGDVEEVAVVEDAVEAGDVVGMRQEADGNSDP